MKRYLKVLALAAFFIPMTISAQMDNEEEMRAKTMESIYEAVEMQMERDIKTYDLEDWQAFKLDSTLVHDFMALTDDYQELKKKGVDKNDYYIKVQDKWMEQIYKTYEAVLSEEQFAKYLKNGAGKEKKARDRRAAQMEVKK